MTVVNVYLLQRETFTVCVSRPCAVIMKKKCTVFKLHPFYISYTVRAGVNNESVGAFLIIHKRFLTVFRWCLYAILFSTCWEQC